MKLRYTIQEGACNIWLNGVLISLWTVYSFGRISVVFSDNGVTAGWM